jgi:hypothetical protein
MLLRKSRLFVLQLVSVALICTGLVQVSSAGIIGTGQIIESDARATSIERIDALLARENVAGQLQEYGVDPAVIEARVRGLTTAELLALESRIDQQVAGAGDVLTLIGAVFIVLLILEVLGVTDIFKSI